MFCANTLLAQIACTCRGRFKLRDGEIEKEIIVRTKRIKFSQQNSRVFIFKDLSREAREKNLRKELKDLKENEIEE